LSFIGVTEIPGLAPLAEGEASRSKPSPNESTAAVVSYAYAFEATNPAARSKDAFMVGVM